MPGRQHSEGTSQVSTHCRIPSPTTPVLLSAAVSLVTVPELVPPELVLLDEESLVASADGLSLHAIAQQIHASAQQDTSSAKRLTHAS